MGLGAGSLLDIGIYALTWGLVALEPPLDHHDHHNQISCKTEEGVGEGKRRKSPEIFSVQTLEDGIDVATSMILFYHESGRQGILTSSLMH